MTTKPFIPPVPGEVVVAHASNEYRIKRYIMVALIVGMSLYFLYDGFIGYPAENERASQLGNQIEEAKKAGNEAEVSRLAKERTDLKYHTDLDIRLQKQLGMALLPISIALLAWALYNSRGAYRLVGNTLKVPGHPQVPLDSIVEIDRTRWDRKGIAYIFYQLDGSTEKKRIRLDDFVYERKPTDRIFTVIEEHMARIGEAASGGF
jgi:hypothetical protein